MTIPLYPNLLIREPSKDEKVRKAQYALAWQIDGYTDATAELSRFISKLYREKNPHAKLIHNTLKPLTVSQYEKYEDMCNYANDEAQIKKDIAEEQGEETQAEEKAECYWCGKTCCGENGVFFETKDSKNNRLQSLSINNREGTLDVELFINGIPSRTHIVITHCPNCGRRLEGVE
ncbi:MAG: hypothetical protein BWY46_01410 [Firmicutes bacterium ADurb.Bin300]|nr:MAG: hypothetical protein BWY46_01410 [Firmicutes bacterium ADurb.Bin300]